jgi:transposase
MPKNKLCLQSIKSLLPWKPFYVVRDDIPPKEAQDKIHHLWFEWNPENSEPLSKCCGERQTIHCWREIDLQGVSDFYTQKSIWHVKYAVRKCYNCGRFNTDEIPFRFGLTKCTIDLAKKICDDLSTSESIKSVANRYALSWDTVKNVSYAMLKDLKAREKIPEKPRICIVDEFSVEKHHKYATLVIDAERKYPLWIARGNEKNSFKPFFHKYRKIWYDKLEAFAMDQNAGYAAVVKEEMPNVTVVCDPFHMIKNYNDDVIEPVRKRFLRESKRNGDEELSSLLKGSKRLLGMKFQGKLSKKEHEAKLKLDLLMEQNKELDTCIHVREQLQGLYDTCRDEKLMEKKWNEWCSIAEASDVPELVRFARKKRAKSQEVINHAKFAISSGPIEGFMNKIKVIKRNAYGYRDWDYFFLRIWWALLPVKDKGALYLRYWDEQNTIEICDRKGNKIA